MTEKLFVSMTSRWLSEKFAKAEHFVCYAAPGILSDPAEALVGIYGRIESKNIAVHLDFDSDVFRMGFGSWEAVEKLRAANIEIYEAPGLRIGLAIVDSEGYIFTPTARLVEDETQPGPAPNAMQLTENQIANALARFSTKTNLIAQTLPSRKSVNELDKPVAEVERNELVVEVEFNLVKDSVFTEVKKEIDDVPPVQFDLARKVRVISRHLQYVELNLTGATIRRHKVRIPAPLLKFGSNVATNEELARRLHTTFDLIEQDDKISLKEIEGQVKDIRRDFTRVLDDDNGRVLLVSVKAEFQKLITNVQQKLENYKNTMKDKLENEFEKSRMLIIDFYLPLVRQRPPDSLRSGLMSSQPPSDDDIKRWIKRELGKVFPTAEEFIAKMKFDVKYKDVTIETMDQEGFLDAVKKAYPDVDWNKPYKTYMTQGIKQS